LIRAAVLTVSDGCHRGAREDRSGPAVRQLCIDCGWRVLVSGVLPDQAGLISSWLCETADSGSVDVIFTTGGTGVAPRDVTPEATRAVIDRDIPGIGELMRAEGRKSTPYAPLSRGIAGVRGRVLIVNLPGSPKGAVESLGAIVQLVPHIIRLLAGDTGHPEHGETAT
jgi:molybdenum cofactor synthesis domain-containing protein